CKQMACKVARRSLCGIAQSVVLPKKYVRPPKSHGGQKEGWNSLGELQMAQTCSRRSTGLSDDSGGTSCDGDICGKDRHGADHSGICGESGIGYRRRPHL
ncbi:hypothetical protein, partial [uncultured Ruminococcus sp.]|uniref:hypothetical protein n=1 Tax=uncultured Ruminococcus sp. TaxID=165186 RepID=UPI00266CB2CB